MDDMSKVLSDLMDHFFPLFFCWKKNRIWFAWKNGDSVDSAVLIMHEKTRRNRAGLLCEAGLVITVALALSPSIHYTWMMVEVCAELSVSLVLSSSRLLFVRVRFHSAICWACRLDAVARLTQASRTDSQALIELLLICWPTSSRHTQNADWRFAQADSSLNKMDHSLYTLPSFPAFFFFHPSIYVFFSCLTGLLDIERKCCDLFIFFSVSFVWLVWIFKCRPCCCYNQKGPKAGPRFFLLLLLLYLFLSLAASSVDRLINTCQEIDGCG